MAQTHTKRARERVVHGSIRTFKPGCTSVPRCRMMMFPGTTAHPTGMQKGSTPEATHKIEEGGGEESQQVQCNKHAHSLLLLLLLLPHTHTPTQSHAPTHSYSHTHSHTHSHSHTHTHTFTHTHTRARVRTYSRMC